MTFVQISDAHTLSKWRRPFFLLVCMAIAMQLSFALWSTLLNNFVHEVAHFDGKDLGWLQSIREVPGFFAVGVIVVLYLMREQVLALVSLVLLGGAVAVTAYFPTFGGLLLTTFISSLGFHYYETAQQSLSLQWLDKKEAPQMLGWLVAAGSGAALFIYLLVIFAWQLLGWRYEELYLLGGGLCLVIVVFCFLNFPAFTTKTPQHKKLILRREYWLYYLLQFMAGARRQIFLVFAAFMMVEKFGFEVHELTALFLINFIANMIFAPVIGGLIGRFGERWALVLEYIGLTLIFGTYAGIYLFDWGFVLAAALYVLDHLFFALAIAQKTYFQKIARPEDMAPTAAVAFTINHIGAVVLPALLGYVWIVSPASVFAVATAFAFVSLLLSLLIPRHPDRGNETILARG
ncbi:MAG: MFS transporter [Pseudomonadota bacterium]